MKVADLIMKLYTMPQNAEVYFYHECAECGHEVEADIKMNQIGPDKTDENDTIWIEEGKRL